MPRKKKEETVIEEKPVKTTRKKPDQTEVLYQTIAAACNAKKPDQTEVLYQTIAAACNAGIYGKGKIMEKRVNGLGYGPIFTMVKKYLTIR